MSISVAVFLCIGNGPLSSYLLFEITYFHSGVMFYWQMRCCHGHRCLLKFCQLIVGTDVGQKVMVMYLSHPLLVCTLLLCQRGDHCRQTPPEKCEGSLLEAHLN